MYRTLIKTQRRLWIRSTRNNASIILVMIMMLFYGLIGTATLGGVLWSESGRGHFGGLATVFAIGLLMYLMTIIMIPAGENHIQPEEFVGLDIDPTAFFKAHLVTGLTSSRGIVAIVCSTITAVIFAMRTPPIWRPAVVLIFLVQLALTIALGELISASFASQKERKSKERTTILSSLSLLVIVFGYNMLINRAGDIPKLWEQARYLQWTPLGSAGGALAALIDAHYLQALIFFSITCLTLALAVWGWRRALLNRLVAPLDRGAAGSETRASTRKAPTSAYLPLVPHTPSGAVYSRALRYFVRDPRLTNTLLVLPILSIFFIYQSYNTGVDFQLYLGLFLMAFMSCSLGSNDFGYDGPAVWMYLASGLRPRTIAWARHLASLTIPFCFALIYSAAVLVIAHDKLSAAFLVPAGLLAFLVASAIAQALTAFNPFPTAPPGTNPWSDKSGYSGAAFLSAMAALFLGWVPILPGVGILFWHRHAGQLWQAGLGWGLLSVLPVTVFLVARYFASRRVDQQLPEIFAKVCKHV